MSSLFKEGKVPEPKEWDAAINTEEERLREQLERSFREKSESEHAEELIKQAEKAERSDFYWPPEK